MEVELVSFLENSKKEVGGWFFDVCVFVIGFVCGFVGGVWAVSKVFGV